MSIGGYVQKPYYWNISEPEGRAKGVDALK